MYRGCLFCSLYPLLIYNQTPEQEASLDGSHYSAGSYKEQNWEGVILGDPGADSGGEGKSKRAEKYETKKSKERREEPNVLSDNVLSDQFQTVASVLSSDWAEKHKRFLAPIRSQNGGDRLELVW